VLELAGFLLAAVLAAFFLWDRYRPRPLRVDVDSKNTIVARLGAPGHNIDGHIGIAFYGLKVVNVSRSTTTVRDLQLQYRLGKIKREATSHVLLTGQVYAPLEKKDVDAAIVLVGDARVVLMNWSNLRSRIAEHVVLEPGGVLSGSALFLLDADDFETLKDLRDVRLVVTDSRGRRSTQAVDIDQESIERGADAVIMHRNFRSEPDGGIVFV
jgi:hypothetical protein